MLNKKVQAKDGAKENFARMQSRILILFIAVILVVVGVLTTVMLSMASEILSDKVSALISANSRQIELNIDSYLKKVETTTTLIYANEDYYTYDPVKNRIGEYERIKLSEAIESRLVDLGLMDNFCDFAILYSNGDRIGWLSNTTSQHGSVAEIYKELDDALEQNIANRGWLFNFGDITSRMYYGKRLNENSILIASFYTKELESVFLYPEQLKGMEISLIGNDNTIVYSSNADSIGGTVSVEIARALELEDGEGDAKYLVNTNTCSNGWRVVCAVPIEVVFKEMASFRLYAILCALVLIIIFCGVTYLLLRRAVKPMDAAVNNLEEEAVTDRLSGVFNKLAFQDAVSKKLSESSFSQTKAFVMIDMDNFKTINDTLGHTYGDNVIERMGKLLAKVFKQQYIVGRLGGDEFAVYCDCGNAYPELALKNIISDVEKLRREFLVEYKEERKKIPISLSIGITVEKDERRFRNLYAHADSALYKSKEAGKNRYTIYEAEEVEDEA